MDSNSKPTGKSHSFYISVLFPIWGIFVFMIMYAISARLYPGGSQVDPYAKGFSWINNYWCNLLEDPAIDGRPNPARPIALAAMLVLSVALSWFWFVFPIYMALSRRVKYGIRISGLLSMLAAQFIFTGLHDLFVNLASIFGLLATIGTLIGLYKLKWKSLYRAGLFMILLVLVNNILYYGRGMRLYLPIVQKISFLYFLLWLVSICISLIASDRKIHQPHRE
jgi:hypothetical protein